MKKKYFNDLLNILNIALKNNKDIIKYKNSYKNLNILKYLNDKDIINSYIFHDYNTKIKIKENSFNLKRVSFKPFKNYLSLSYKDILKKSIYYKDTIFSTTLGLLSFNEINLFKIGGIPLFIIANNICQN